MRLGLWLLAVVLLAGCGALTSTASSPTPAAPASSAPSNSSASASPPSSAPPTPTKAAPVGPILKGYGATIADWNANHRADPRYDPGAAYNPTPGYGPDEQHDDAFFAVSATDRVESFSMNMPHATTTQEALSLVLASLPPDGKILWQAKKDTCYQAEMDSATLEKVIGRAGRVGMFVELDSDEANGGNPYWSPRNVTEAIVQPLFYATAADSIDC